MPFPEKMQVVFRYPTKFHGQSKLDYFKNKVRFEMKLNSKQAIRSTLNIEDTSISEILNSDKKPIYDLSMKLRVNQFTFVAR